jgi:hypothetical protein
LSIFDLNVKPRPVRYSNQVSETKPCFLRYGAEVLGILTQVLGLQQVQGVGETGANTDGRKIEPDPGLES